MGIINDDDDLLNPLWPNGKFGERTAPSAIGLPGYDKSLTDVGEWPGEEDEVMTVSDARRTAEQALMRAHPGWQVRIVGDAANSEYHGQHKCGQSVVEPRIMPSCIDRLDCLRSSGSVVQRIKAAMDNHVCNEQAVTIIDWAHAD